MGFQPFDGVRVRGGRAERGATVRLYDRAPVTVVGRGFVAGERVQVRVAAVASGAFAKRVTAGRRGGFTVVFRARSLDHCVGYTISATGSKGSRATARDLVPPPCGIDPQP